MEDSPSGLWRTLGKRVGVTASRVRISYPPPDARNHCNSNGFGFSFADRIVQLPQKAANYDFPTGLTLGL